MRLLHFVAAPGVNLCLLNPTKGATKWQASTAENATVHANTDGALAVGFTMVNAGATFISPDLNKWDLSQVPPRVSGHRQPYWAERAVAKLTELPRRTSKAHEGYDAFGIVVVDMTNDGSPVHMIETPPAPRPADRQRHVRSLCTDPGLA